MGVSAAHLTMRVLLVVFSIILLLGSAQARRGRRGRSQKICSDGCKPTCSDGVEPGCPDGQPPAEETRTGRRQNGGQRNPRLRCSDGSKPACSDSEKPRTCADGIKPQRYRPCPNGGRPSCPVFLRPTCGDGSRPRNWQCSDGTQPTCTDRINPLCDDGAEIAAPPTCSAA